MFKEKAIRHTASDRAQYARYRHMLGQDCPADLAAFQRIKYTDEARWGRMKWDYRFENKYHAKDASELLPNHSEAYGINEKLTAYSLNPEHETGKNKAKVFQSALGFNGDNTATLEREIRKGVAAYKAYGIGDRGYGNKYSVVMLISGPKGKQPIKTGWIYNKGIDSPRMVTAYVEDHKRP